MTEERDIGATMKEGLIAIIRGTGDVADAIVETVSATLLSTLRATRAVGTEVSSLVIDGDLDYLNEYEHALPPERFQKVLEIRQKRGRTPHPIAEPGHGREAGRRLSSCTHFLTRPRQRGHITSAHVMS